jgi:hypothetical protein
MAKFLPNTPVVQQDPQVRVDVTLQQPLPLGVNRFQLVVVDDAGNESAPTVLQVIVKDKERPTGVLNLVDANGQVIAAEVAFGTSFILSGARSSDVPPGRIVEWRFTLLGQA